MSQPTDERPSETAAPDRRSVLQTVTPDDGGTSSRRGVLAGAVASVAAALGFTGTVAGVDPGRVARLRRVERRYRSETAALDTIQDRGTDVLGLLAEEGYLARGDVAELDAPEVNAVETDGTATGHLAAATDVEGGQLTVVVEPEADRQYAILDLDDREEHTVFNPDLGGVQPRCPSGFGCEGGGCVCEEWELTYCNNTCHKYSQSGFQCSDCIACGSPACGY